MCWLKQAVLLLVLVSWAGRVQGQGLVVSGAPAPLGASGAFSSLAALYEKSKAWKAAFRRSPASACASGGDTLCSAGAVDGNAAAYGQLVVATSPLIYSSARPADTGGFDFIPDPRDQRPCAACTGFAVAAAAQAAVAAAARVNASDVEPLSAADLVYCSPGAPTSCSAGWTLADVLKQLTERRIAPEACMPYDPPSIDGSRSASCGPTCRAPGALRARVEPSQGVFEYESLADEWAICQHIREYGSVVSRFDILADFREFYDSPSREAAVYRPAPGAKLVETHAVIIIGYNLVEGYWLIQNSWGPEWNGNGRFKAAFGCCSLATAPDLYGIRWTPTKQQANKVWPPPGLQKSSNCTGGYIYTATPSDYLSGIALRYDLKLRALLLDNVAAIRDLDEPLTGKRLLLCGMQSPLEKLSARAHAAIAAGTFGVSWGGAWFLSVYNLGVLTALRDLGLVDAKTKMSGVAQLTQCAMCAGYDPAGYLKYLSVVVAQCDKLNHCQGTLEKALRNAIAAWVVPPDAWKRCAGVCYVGLASTDGGGGGGGGSGGGSLGLPSARYFDVTDFTSQADFIDAVVATHFMPVFSSPASSFNFRGIGVESGWFVQKQPPCAPGVEFCLRVSAFRAPDVGPSPDLRFAFNIMLRLNHGDNRTKLTEIFGPNAPAAAAAALAYAPPPAALKSAAAAAAALDVDIAPNLFTPIPLQPQVDWMEATAIPPDGPLTDFLYKLGVKDTHAWVRALGVGGNGTAAGAAGKPAGAAATNGTAAAAAPAKAVAPAAAPAAAKAAAAAPAAAPNVSAAAAAAKALPQASAAPNAPAPAAVPNVSAAAAAPKAPPQAPAAPNALAPAAAPKAPPLAAAGGRRR